MLKLLRLPRLGETGKERLKRGLLLLIGCGIVLLGVRLLASKKVISSDNIPIGQEQLVDLGGKVLNKALGVLGKGDQKGQEGKEKEEVGQVAGVIEEVANDPQKVVEKVVEKTVEKTVEKRVEEIIETIKKLPEEQVERVKKEIMKEMCEEICETE